LSDSKPHTSQNQAIWVLEAPIKGQNYPSKIELILNAPQRLPLEPIDGFLYKLNLLAQSDLYMNFKTKKN
jgi:hypothetical protein